jgi:hypothetical protein
MKLNPKIEEVFFGNAPSKTITGDGFSVHVFFPFAIRYIESGKTLTVSAEPRIKERAGTFFLPRILRELLANTWIEVCIQEPLHWDNSAEQPQTPEEVIVERIEASLKTSHFAYEVKRIREAT